MKKIVLFLIALNILTSCEKPSLKNENQSFSKNNLRYKDFSKDDYRLEFVRIFAKALEDKNLRKFVKTKSLEKFSGDYDFPYILVKDEIVIGKETFSDILSKNIDSEHIKKFGLDFFSQRIINNDPYLSILVPVLKNENPETWDINSTPEVVAYTESKNDEFQGYDKNGKIKIFWKNIEPKNMTLVCKDSEGLIGVNNNSFQTILGNSMEMAVFGKQEKDEKMRNKIKRIVEKSKKSMKVNIMNNNFTFILLKDIYFESNSIPKINNKARIRNISSCRDDFPNQKDYVNDYTVSEGGWDIAHDWFEGSEIEICSYIYLASYPNNNPTFSSLLKRDAGRTHSDYANGPITINWDVVDWDKATFGQLMKYKWFDSDESEWSGSITGNSTYKNDSLGITIGVSGTLAYSAKNDELGESFVEYCDLPYPWSYNFYNTGLVFFRISVHY